MGILMINTNPFNNYMVCKNNFFKNPDKIVSLFDQQEFLISPLYPGKRTNNLLESSDEETKNFALYLSQRISDEVYPGIYDFMIDIRFHINHVYSDPKLNEGWIHCDNADLAGLIYMSKEEFSLETGTSMFAKKTDNNFAVKDFKSRQEFNVTGQSSEQYLKDLEENHQTFIETMRVGNVYNRLVAYDARIFHRPNRYNLNSQESRKSIVFFIRNFKREYTSKINLKFNWEDV